MTVVIADILPSRSPLGLTLTTSLGGNQDTPSQKNKKHWGSGMPGGRLPARPHLTTILGALIS